MVKQIKEERVCPDHKLELDLRKTSYGSSMDEETDGVKLEVYVCPDINCKYRLEVKY